MRIMRAMSAFAAVTSFALGWIHYAAGFREGTSTVTQSTTPWPMKTLQAFGNLPNFDFTTPSHYTTFDYYWETDDESLKNVAVDAYGKGLVLSLKAPELYVEFPSARWLFFGKASVEVISSKTPWMTTIFMLQSRGGWLLRWDIPGGHGTNEATASVQYVGEIVFLKTHSLSEGVFYDESWHDGNETSVSHQFTISWTTDWILFAMDGEVKETILRTDIGKGPWPEVPMRALLVMQSGGNDPPPLSVTYWQNFEFEDFKGNCLDHGWPLQYKYRDGAARQKDVNVAQCWNWHDYTYLPLGVMPQSKEELVLQPPDTVAMHKEAKRLADEADDAEEEWHRNHQGNLWTVNRGRGMGGGRMIARG
ncbi:hypothetical protein B0I35DRAFT_407277 [Stachybotrys elegans]|uniref:GH16 domain-containing protein n=1 Tax=Stachybotrys elegans TaxID=80388 RepID=A0A8K0SRW1_9HYPO|nr:hypothetical protein B0I35DRAFT_407277 [Stachybotrys elegans]